MIFRQRIGITEVAIYPWAPTQSWILRTLGSGVERWHAYGDGMSAATANNAQLVVAVAMGILIGLGSATLLTEQLGVASGYALFVCSLAILQLPLQQGLKRQEPEDALPQQETEKHNHHLNQQEAQKQSAGLAPLGDNEEMTLFIEDALRHLHDCSYLGLHPLAQLQIVKRRQWQRSDGFCMSTHVSLGHALHSLLIDVIGLLRPTGQLSTGAVIPQREWHPYVILHSQYVQHELTREVMARLYIGEGTYNRTRRRAVQSIAKAILELEEQARLTASSSPYSIL